uniref:Uncharacterized protein MANES_12G018300 n=1 Tax=Rhizophora mucronata TaxID=61149 RepID=A0A2P2NGW5_RHIMU
MAKSTRESQQPINFRPTKEEFVHNGVAEILQFLVSQLLKGSKYITVLRCWEPSKIESCSFQLCFSFYSPDSFSEATISKTRYRRKV